MKAKGKRVDVELSLFLVQRPMGPGPDDVARCCLAVYDSLSRTGKPLLRDNGRPEWTCLAGFVLARPSSTSGHILKCISLGYIFRTFCSSLHAQPHLIPLQLSGSTGVKCLPYSRLPVHGDVLHDSHAEIIARRGFLLWLYRELAAASTSDWLKPSESRWKLKSGVSLSLYISALPCTISTAMHSPIPRELNLSALGGDASMLSLSLSQAADDAVPLEATADERSLSKWGELALPISSSVSTTTLGRIARGRIGYDNIGSLRTKPGPLPPRSLCST
jgi:tRNA-specific adenosine deaminase 1